VEAPNLVIYLDSLFRYALILTRHHADAEDLVQETYVRAFQKIDSVRNPNSVKSWMFTILRNTWTSQKRRQKSTRIETEFDLSSIRDIDHNLAGDALSHYEKHYEREVVRKALQQLPLEDREILILREYDDLSYKRIADILNCPIGTVMSRLARARLKLRDLLSTAR
jgi:RNA polymerase sigma-70 factor (ECF subfamily)